MEEIVTTPVPAETVEVVDIQFRPGQKIYYFDPAGFTCKTGDHVIIDTARGPEFGICASGNHRIPSKDIVSPLRSVIRMAGEKDEKNVAENRIKEKKAHEVCLQKIEELGLDMQLVSAECTFDGSKILFFFTADERVDFRELVKNLASTFHTRIELRQIGVRDKAKMVGGLGICGRPFCCASFLDDFQPVSIKMAKTQNLSLNPTKISGTCGRLMCCLKYEQDAYEDLIRRSPKEESFVDTPEGRGTVVGLNLLRQQVKVQMEDSPETISTFKIEEIAVLRNGKAKKSDPPIPADLAPISGGGKRQRKSSLEKVDSFLDPIKFRYREEKIVDEQIFDDASDEGNSEQGRSRRRRNKHKHEAPIPEKQPQKQEKPVHKAEKPAAKPEKPVQKHEKQEAAAATEAAEKPKAHHHRNYHHRRRHHKGGSKAEE